MTTKYAKRIQAWKREQVQVRESAAVDAEEIYNDDTPRQRPDGIVTMRWPWVIANLPASLESKVREMATLGRTFRTWNGHRI